MDVAIQSVAADGVTTTSWPEKDAASVEDGASRVSPVSTDFVAAYRIAIAMNGYAAYTVAGNFRGGDCMGIAKQH